MRKVGYARVSTKGQSEDRQIAALKEYVDKDMILVDKFSGKNFDRPSYQSLKTGLGKLVEGDELYVYELDRFGRNKKEIKKELEYFSGLGIRVKIITVPTTMLDFPTEQKFIQEMITNIIIEVLSSIAQHELEHTAKRQAEGIEAMSVIDGKRYSKKKKNFMGRPKIDFPINWNSVYSEWEAQNITARAAMLELGLKSGTFYNLVKRHKEASI